MRSALILRVLIIVAIFYTNIAGQSVEVSAPTSDTKDQIQKIPGEDLHESLEGDRPKNTTNNIKESIIPEVNAQELKPQIPVRIKSEKINLDAPIKQEGKTKEGRMDVPKDNATVGWWKLGRRPGEVGSAVLAGHYKVDDGSPGVFYRLNELQTGDILAVSDRNGNEKLFQITDIKVYSEKEFPLEYVFARRESKRLNLITCTGKYIPELDDYSHRLVLFAEMVE